MVPVREGMLRVQLKLVDLEGGQKVHEGVERLHGGDLVPADVEHDPAVGEIGPVANAQGRQSVPALLKDLAQGHDAVERARGGTRHHVDALPGDGQLVALGMAHRAGDDTERHPYLARGHHLAADNLPPDMGIVSQGSLESAGGKVQSGGIGGIDDN